MSEASQRNPPPAVRSVNAQTLDLGIRLNHLLDQSICLGKVPGYATYPHGLILPTAEDLGSGNVVIVGEPGSGKSTLALQIAVAATDVGCDAAYISMEEERERVKKKAGIFGWEPRVWYSEKPLDFIRTTAPLTQGAMRSDPDWLREVLKVSRASGDPDKGRVIIPGLLPRPLAQSGALLTRYFWDQYSQIEFLVRSAADHCKAAQSSDDKTGIRLVIVDSLNMLGMESQNREMLHRLFDLFRRYAIMGVFTVEKNSILEFDSTMGDVVFTFSRKNDSGYEVSLIECTKARFASRTKGVHPYKIKGRDSHRDSLAPENRGECGIVVFPSPHAVVAATEPTQLKESEKRAFPFGWGDTITKNMLRSTHQGAVAALVGPRGTFKSQIALNFLLHGLANKQSCIYLRLRTPEPLKIGDTWTYADPIVSPAANGSKEPSKDEVEAERVRQADEVKKRQDVDWLRLHVTPFQTDFLQSISSRTKVEISIQTVGGSESNEKLVVADFRTGMLLAEEFIDTVRRVFDAFGAKRPARVVLDDVGSIGASYPLLKHSTTTGDLFLSAFVHIMKNYGVDLLLVGTTSELPEANHMVNQACMLADTVLRTSVGVVFGDQYVLLSGDGTATKAPNEGDNPPAVLLPESDKRRLKPDAQLLDEFVGFDSGRIQRPGIILHLYQENETQKQYNTKLANRLQERYGRPGAESKPWELNIAQRSGVEVIPFPPGGMAQLQHYDRRIQERPRNHTAIRMIDEFETTDSTPTYECIRNVMLLAYRSDLELEPRINRLSTWTELLKLAMDCNVPPCPSHLVDEYAAKKRRYGRRFAFDRLAPESLACLVLEGVATGGGIQWDGDRKLDFPAAFTPDVAAKIGAEFQAIHQLAFDHSWTTEERNRFDGNRENDPWLKNLPPDSSFYVCWYSQLRQLLKRHDHLARLLKVRALPGGGFRGDWYLRVEPGSVSMRLGRAIVEHLVSDEEDFERFRVGLSLPVKPIFIKSELLMWPAANSGQNIGLIEKGIWAKAHKRSNLNGYHKFNRLLYGIGETLVGLRFDPRNLTGDRPQLQDFVNRLPDMVSEMRGGIHA